MRFILLLSLFVSNVALAEVTVTSFFSIDRIRISDNTGYVYIQPNEDVTPVNQSCKSTHFFALSKNYDLFQELYSAAYSAALSGKEIRVWISTDQNDCLNGYQKVRLIEVDF